MLLVLRPSRNTNKLCGQNVEVLNVDLVVHTGIITQGFKGLTLKYTEKYGMAANRYLRLAGAGLPD